MKDGSLSPPLPLSFALGAQMGETSVRDHDHPLILGEANVDSAPLDALGKKNDFHLLSTHLAGSSSSE